MRFLNDLTAIEKLMLFICLQGFIVYWSEEINDILRSHCETTMILKTNELSIF